MTDLQDAMLDRLPLRSAETDAEWIDGELLLYDHPADRALYLNPTAATIWSLCDGQTRVQDIVACMQDAYPGTAVAGDIVAAIRDLETNGLVVS